MPSSLLSTMIIEFFLIGLTTVLLVRPEFIFKATAKTFQSWVFGAGWFFLLILFGWSVVLGRMLLEYEIVFR